MPETIIRAPVYPSEDATKVRKAVLNLFPGAQVEAVEGGLVAHLESLDAFRLLIRRQKILDAARRSLLGSLDESKTRGVFRLNKQAAFQGRVSFSGDLSAPLGDLVVDVKDPDLEALFKEMAPMTVRGIPVSEERAEEILAKRRLLKAEKKKAHSLSKEVHEAVEEDWEAGEASE